MMELGKGVGGIVLHKTTVRPISLSMPALFVSRPLAPSVAQRPIPCIPIGWAIFVWPEIQKKVIE